MERPPQWKLVLDYMQKHGSIDDLEAYNALACRRLPARIHDLEKKGYHINHILAKGKNRFGQKVHYTRYSLGE